MFYCLRNVGILIKYNRRWDFYQAHTRPNCSVVVHIIRGLEGLTLAAQDYNQLQDRYPSKIIVLAFFLNIYFNSLYAENIPIEVKNDLYIAPGGQQAVFCFVRLKDLVKEIVQHDSTNPTCAWIVRGINALVSDRTKTYGSYAARNAV